VKQGSASQLDIVGMRAKEQDSFAVEVHIDRVGAGSHRPGRQDAAPTIDLFCCQNSADDFGHY
jgi:hypothetical protein